MKKLITVAILALAVLAAPARAAEPDATAPERAKRILEHYLVLPHDTVRLKTDAYDPKAERKWLRRGKRGWLCWLN